MRCPNCEKTISWNWIESEGMEGGDEFECPSCAVELRYSIDKGTYYGAQQQTLKIVDD